MEAVTRSLVSALRSSGGCCVLRRLGFLASFSGPLLAVEVVAAPETRPNILGWAASPCKVACLNGVALSSFVHFFCITKATGSAAYRLLDVPRYCGAAADAHEAQ